jgi:Xaa-Pro aminopeptidase
MVTMQTNSNRAAIAIPDGDFATRRKALSDALHARGIDAWIAFGDDGACAGPSHIRYLLDLEPHFEPVILLRRADGGELVVTGPETLGYEMVVRRPGIDRVIAASFLGHASEEYPTITLEDGAGEIASFLKGIDRLGLIGCERMPHSFFLEIADALQAGGRKTVNVDDVAFELRAIKTEAEQLVIDEAYRIAKAGLLAAAAEIKAGVSERFIAAIAEAAMRREGAEGFGIDTMVASGVANTQPIIARSSHRTIEAGDLVTVTVAPRYEGYHAALARPFLLERNPELERIVSVARDAQKRCEDALTAGTRGFDAEKLARQTVAAGNTRSSFPYVGLHSIGAVEFEPPIFASHSVETIQPGMALSIDIPMYHAPWGGLRIEDGFQIDAKGAQPRFADYQNMVPLILR